MAKFFFCQNSFVKNVLCTKFFSYGKIFIFRRKFCSIIFSWWKISFSKIFFCWNLFCIISYQCKRIYLEKLAIIFFGKFFSHYHFWQFSFSMKIFYQRHLTYVQDRPRNLPLKFGQDRVSNSWDIQEMEKCRKNKYCLDKCHCYSWNMFKKVPGTYL